MGEGRLMAYFTHASGRLIGKGGDDTWLLRRSDGEIPARVRLLMSHDDMGLSCTYVPPMIVTLHA